MVGIWDGKRVKELRAQKKLSQRNLGMLLGYAKSGAQSQVALWERTGQVPIAKFAQLDAINDMAEIIKPTKKEPKMARKKSLNLVQAVEKATNLSPEKIAVVLGCNSTRSIKSITTGAATGKLPDTLDTLMRILLNVCHATWPNKIDLSNAEEIELKDIYTKCFALTESASEWVKSILSDEAPAAPAVASAPAPATNDVHEVKQAGTAGTITLSDGTTFNGDTGELVEKLDEITTNIPASTMDTVTPPPAPVEPELPTQPVSIPLQQAAQAQTATQKPVAPAPAPMPMPAPAPMPAPMPAPTPVKEPTVFDTALMQKPRTQEFVTWFLAQQGTEEWLTKNKVTADQINDCFDIYELLEPALKQSPRSREFLMWFAVQNGVKSWLQQSNVPVNDVIGVMDNFENSFKQMFPNG